MTCSSKSYKTASYGRFFFRRVCLPLEQVIGTWSHRATNRVALLEGVWLKFVFRGLGVRGSWATAVISFGMLAAEHCNCCECLHCRVLGPLGFGFRVSLLYL